MTLAAAGAPVIAASRQAPVADAAERQDREGVRALLARGADVNEPQEDGTTALHWAAHWNDETMGRTLIQAGARVDAKTDLGLSPLLLACGNGSAGVARLLVGAKSDPRDVLPSGETALMTCARSGLLDVVEQLLARKADPNARVADAHGQTAVMWAASEGHPAVVSALLRAGADANARTGTGLTPLFFAARRGDLASAQALIAAGADVNAAAPDGSTPLLVAAAGINAITASDYRMVPLSSGHEALALALLRAGANDRAADSLGLTALHAAVETDKLALVDALIAKGTDLNARLVKGLPFRRGDYVSRAYYVGATPLWLAAKDGKLDIMRTLVAAGADPHLPSQGGITPIMVAAGLGQTDSRIPPEPRMLEAVTYLLSLGADVNQRNRAGQTAVHGAANVSFDAVIRLLASHGADVNAKDNNGRTAFDLTRNPMRPRPKTGDTLRTLGAVNTGNP